MEQQNPQQPNNPVLDHHHHHHHNNNNNITIVPNETKVVADSGSESVPQSEAGGSEKQQQHHGVVVVVKRGRGRPRKYVNANGGGLLSPVSAPPPGFTAAVCPLESPAAKRSRGRPRGSGKLQILASIGGFVAETAGGSFTPHVMTVSTGEDVVSRILSFFHKGPRAVCILSATGAVSSVVIRQPGVSGGILRYEGRFEILSLSGSCTYSSGNSGAHRKDGMLSVSLAKPDGRVFGGGIESSLIAAGPIQLVLATFKQNISNQIKRRHSSGSSDAPNVPDNQDSARGRHKVPRLLEGEQSCPSPTTSSAFEPKATTTHGVQDGVTTATTNGGPDDVISATTTTNGKADNVIPASTTTNGVSHNVIAEDLNMHSASVDDGVDLDQRTSADVDNSVPQI